MKKNISQQLLEFIENSPTCFHAVQAMTDILSAEGFTELKENQKWHIENGGRYFVTRNGSSLTAFTVPFQEMKGMHIIASHSDSPSFKIKENPELESEGHYIRLNVEGYGGMIRAPWFDRPLSVAGRVIVKDKAQGGFRSILVDIGRDLVMIPNLAIHMDRQINDSCKYNIQKDMLPIYGDLSAKGTFMKLIADTAGVPEEEILGHDLFLYNRQKGTVWGASGEFLSCSRLDDLQCAFASLKGFLAGKRQEYLDVHCVLDNEEVGSGTKQGAASTFLYDTLTRIHTSANRPYINGGIVLKFSASQKYCTDGVSAAMFRDLCQRAGVPVQTFVNRSDMVGGSTLGNISNTQVALNTVDIGLPQLAMHSPYETAGVKDTGYLIRAAEEFFC